MMSREVVPGGDDSLLAKIFETTHSVTNTAVQAEFRIVQDSTDDSVEMQEFVSPRLGGRYVAMESGSDIAGRHAELTEAHIPVLSGIYTDNSLLLLHVPAGTRPVANFTHSMRSNPETFGEVFEEIGETMGQLERGGFGSPEATPDYPIAKQFAIVPDESEAQGGSVRLVPPYLFSVADQSCVLETLRGELTGTGVLLSDQVEYFIGRIEDGWNR